MLLGPGRLAVSERQLPNTVTIVDRFHCAASFYYTAAAAITYNTLILTRQMHSIEDRGEPK